MGEGRRIVREKLILLLVLKLVIHVEKHEKVVQEILK